MKKIIFTILIITTCAIGAFANGESKQQTQETQMPRDPFTPPPIEHNENYLETGMIFIDGKYIEPPYVFTVDQDSILAIFVNGIQATEPLKWPLKHKDVLDYDPGLPPGITKHTKWEETTATEPITGVSWNFAKARYLMRNFSCEEAYEKLVDYYRSFPNVKNFQPEGGGALLETYAGEEMIISFWRDESCYEWRENGYYATLTRDKRVGELMANMDWILSLFQERGCIFFFSQDNYFTFDLNLDTDRLCEMIDILKTKEFTREEKVGKILPLHLFGEDKVRHLIDNFEPSEGLENKIDKMEKINVPPPPQHKSKKKDNNKKSKGNSPSSGDRYSSDAS